MQLRAAVLCLGLVATAGLTGCSATSIFIEDEEIATNSPTDAELEQGVREVIHPNDDIVVAIESAKPLTFVETVLESNPKPAHELESDVWMRVANQFSFEIPEHLRVTNQRNWYVKHPQYMQRVMKRARPFLYYIVEEIEARDMPLELTLLPIVESAFDPFAYSHGRAAGMWQFIPGTAKRFGMRQTWWYDGRRDVIASTQIRVRLARSRQRTGNHDC